MAANKTTFSIEIFNGESCENNAYGVRPFVLFEQMNELIKQIPMDKLFSKDGLDIQIRKEE